MHTKLLFIKFSHIHYIENRFQHTVSIWLPKQLMLYCIVQNSGKGTLDRFAEAKVFCYYFSQSNSRYTEVAKC